MKRFAKIVNGKKLLIIFAKCFILDFSQGSEYVSGLNTEIYNIQSECSNIWTRKNSEFI